MESDQAPVVLGDAPLRLEDIVRVSRRNAPVRLGEAARARMVASHAVVDRLAAGGAAGPAVYGINTGFGALAEVRISPAQVVELQKNLVRSHSSGVGTPLPSEAVRARVPPRAPVLAVAT